MLRPTLPSIHPSILARKHTIIFIL